MNQADEIERIRKEYSRRSKEIPEDYYSLKYPWNRLMHEGRVEAAARQLKKFGLFPLGDAKILEVGCGRGEWFSDLISWGAHPGHLSGIDLDEERLKIARAQYPESDLRLGDASNLPYESGVFDLVLQSTVFTSILDFNLKKKIANEMMRVVKKSGAILWYDFKVNNPWNPNVKGVGSREIRTLFPNCEVCLESITLAPPITRFLAGKSLGLCRFLEDLKIFNTHYLGVIRCR